MPAVPKHVKTVSQEELGVASVPISCIGDMDSIVFLIPEEE